MFIFWFLLSQEHYGDVNHTGRRVLDSLNLVKQTVDVVSEAPSRYIKNLVSDAIAPGYWIPNSEIKVRVPYQKCSTCSVDWLV